uniref:Uncharacterized protein n=1 Tax=Pipistrellus kuhlii TaxID=59472 RepID=A0A7J7WLD9_PIPKU|nr:hypothetical protein mPipKuh1_007930 [Pipistrellus kuhlii]
MRLKVLRKLGYLQKLTSAAQRPLGQLHHHPHCSDPTVQGREGIRQRLAECRILECLLSLLAAWSISLNHWAIVSGGRDKNRRQGTLAQAPVLVCPEQTPVYSLRMRQFPLLAQAGHWWDPEGAEPRRFPGDGTAASAVD